MSYPCKSLGPFQCTFSSSFPWAGEIEKQERNSGRSKKYQNLKKNAYLFCRSVTSVLWDQVWDDTFSVSSLCCIISLLREHLARVPEVPPKWYWNAKLLSLYFNEMLEEMGVLLGLMTAAGSPQFSKILYGKVLWNTVNTDYFSWIRLQNLLDIKSIQ